jgi:hypothetical protein
MATHLEVERFRHRSLKSRPNLRPHLGPYRKRRPKMGQDERLSWRAVLFKLLGIAE